jgi:hypothetical protein
MRLASYSSGSSTRPITIPGSLIGVEARVRLAWIGADTRMLMKSNDTAGFMPPVGTGFRSAARCARQPTDPAAEWVFGLALRGANFDAYPWMGMGFPPITDNLVEGMGLRRTEGGVLIHPFKIAVPTLGRSSGRIKAWAVAAGSSPLELS